MPVGNRLWNLLKPPPDAIRPGEIAHRKRQRRLLTITFVSLLVLAAGGGIYYYFASAPQRADKEFQNAMKLMKPGTYPLAAQGFTRALEINPQLAEAYLERGNAYHYMSQDDGALADFQSAAELNSGLAAAHNGMSMIYLNRKDTRRAFDELSKSISLKPTIDAYYQRGQIYESRGEHQKAIDDYTNGIAEMTEAPYIYRARALARVNIGDMQGAKADREMADKLEGHNVSPAPELAKPPVLDPDSRAPVIP